MAALAIELVAPTVEAVANHDVNPLHEQHDPFDAFVALIIGSLLGCLLFVILDQMVNAHGGFLRKQATAVAYFTRKKKDLDLAILKDLAKVEIFQSMPAAAIQSLVDLAKPVQFNAGEELFEQGEPGEELFLVRDGRIQLYQDDVPFKQMEAGAVIGEMALLTGAPRLARAVAETGVHALMLKTTDFDRLRGQYPELDSAVRELVSARMDELNATRMQRHQAEQQWARQAAKALRTGVEVPSHHDLRVAHAKHSGAPMAIWLGILLDGIPESFVIGTGLASILLVHESAGLPMGFFDVVPYTLLAGLFLSNFPEALSSSVGMKEQGMDGRRIFLLWFSLMVMTGIGASAGYALGGTIPHAGVIGVQGVAAGAMLTMIGAAMIPEAAHRGGPVLSGVGTLLGFIVAISFKLLE